MPQRFLKPGLTTSLKWNACSWQAQSFYVRILTLVDDFGRCEGAATLLRSLAFPLHEDIRTPQVQKLGEELQANQLAVFYKVDGKDYVQLRNWTERARVDVSRYPGPDGKKGKWKDDDGPQDSAANGSVPQPPKPPSSPSSSSSSKPSPSSASSPPRAKLTEEAAPEVLEPKRQERPNSPELAFAQAEFVRINDRCRAEPGFTPYSAEEVRQAWQWFESGKDADTGEWLLMFGSQRKPVGDWKAALMERIGHNRNIYAKRNANSPARGEDTRDHAAGF